jgi:hypothetical protein
MSGAFKVRHRLRGEKAEVEERVKGLEDSLADQVVATVLEGVVATAVGRADGMKEEGRRLMTEMEREARDHRRTQEEAATECLRLKGENAELQGSLRREKAVWQGKAESEKAEAARLRARAEDLEGRLEIVRQDLASKEKEVDKFKNTQVRDSRYL